MATVNNTNAAVAATGTYTLLMYVTAMLRGSQKGALAPLLAETFPLIVTARSFDELRKKVVTPYPVLNDLYAAALAGCVGSPLATISTNVVARKYLLGEIAADEMGFNKPIRISNRSALYNIYDMQRVRGYFSGYNAMTLACSWQSACFFYLRPTLDRYSPLASSLIAGTLSALVYQPCLTYARFVHGIDLTCHLNPDLSKPPDFHLFWGQRKMAFKGLKLQIISQNILMGTFTAYEKYFSK